MKWHLPSSASAEHRGRTEKAVIKEHKAVFEYLKTLETRLTIDRNQILQESEIHFEVLQQYSVGVRGDRIVLGNIRLNLCEYVNKHDEDDGTSSSGAGTADNDSDSFATQGIIRRYLMQDSKVNSTLKIAIRMRHTEGDRNFVAPPLKSAMVFGGIAGIMNAEQAELSDDNGHMPSLTSKTRDMNELQDTYRRTLAAAWSCTPGELPPDRLVEDIFAGGDGGNMLPPPNTWASRQPSRHGHDRPNEGDRDDEDTASLSDSESRLTIRGHSPSHIRSTSSTFLSPNSAVTSKSTPHTLDASPTFRHLRNRHSKGGSLDTPSMSMSTSSSSSNITGVSGRGSIEQQMRHQHDREKQKQKINQRRGIAGGHRSSTHELTEFDVREDLKSWTVEVNE